MSNRMIFFVCELPPPPSPPPPASLFPVHCPTQSPSEVVLQSCRGALLNPGREAGRTARGLASPELNVLIALELLRVFAGGNYPRDLR